MAVDYFLKIDGVEGESSDSKHKGEIEIESFSWGVSNSGSAAHGTGAGTGKPSFQDFHFLTPVTKASPQLFLACAKGNHIQTATLTCRKAGERPLEFYVVTMSDLLVSSYQQDGQSSGDVPMDQVSLNFSKITVAYTVQDERGTRGETVEAGWDLKSNKAT